MLLSLERLFITGALTVVIVRTTPKHRKRQDVAVWSGSEIISKADKGNTGEPTVSTRANAENWVNRVNKGPGYAGNLLLLL